MDSTVTLPTSCDIVRHEVRQPYVSPHRTPRTRQATRQTKKDEVSSTRQKDEVSSTRQRPHAGLASTVGPTIAEMAIKQIKTKSEKKQTPSEKLSL